MMDLRVVFIGMCSFPARGLHFITLFPCPPVQSQNKLGKKKLRGKTASGMGLVQVLWSFEWTTFSEPGSCSEEWWTDGPSTGVGFPSQVKWTHGCVQWEFVQKSGTWPLKGDCSNLASAPWECVPRLGFSQRKNLFFSSPVSLNWGINNFLLFWLAQGCLSFKNKPMFVSVILCCLKPFAKFTRRKWDYWHHPRHPQLF